MDGFVVDRGGSAARHGARAAGGDEFAQARGACGGSSDSFESTRAWKTAPRPATPVAIPTWRKVVLIPEPIPDFSTGTTAIAAWPIPGLVVPDPDPGGDEAGQQRRPVRVGRDPVHQQEADADDARPVPSRTRIGICARARRDRGDDEAEHGQRQEAQPRLERRESSTPCM